MQQKHRCRHRQRHQQHKQQLQILSKSSSTASSPPTTSLDGWQVRHLVLCISKLQRVECHYHYAPVERVRLFYHTCTHRVCRNAAAASTCFDEDNDNVSYGTAVCGSNSERTFTVHMSVCRIALAAGAEARVSNGRANAVGDGDGVCVNDGDSVDDDDSVGVDDDIGCGESVGDDVDGVTDDHKAFGDKTVDDDESSGKDSDSDDDSSADDSNSNSNESSSDDDQQQETGADEKSDAIEEDVAEKADDDNGCVNKDSASDDSDDDESVDEDECNQVPAISFSQFCKTSTFSQRPRKTNGDHNRIIGNGPTPTSQTTQSTAAVTKNNAAANAAAVAANAAVVNNKQVELHEIGNYNNNNNNHHITNNGVATGSSNNSCSSSGGTTTATDKPNARTNSQNSSPILGQQQQQQQQQHGRKVIGTGAATTAIAGAGLLEKKSIRKSIFHKSQPRTTEATAASPPPTATNRTPEYLDASELQRLKHLNRHSCNGRLDFEALERYLQQSELDKQQQDKGVEAMGVLLQYLVYELDAFACPTLKRQGERTKETLERTQHLLDEAKSACNELQDQLCEKEAYYAKREDELQTMHCCELEKAKASLVDLQTYCREQQCAYDSQVNAKETEHKHALHACQLELEKLRGEKQQEHDEGQTREQQLQQRIQALERVEQELLERLHSAEQRHNERETELNERVRTLAKELEMARISQQHTEREQRELRDKLNVSREEANAVVRSTNRSISEIAPMGSSSSMNASFSEMTRLQSEAESLRCVLELKQKEISKLTKQNEELLRDADERLALQARISSLESRNEMLQSELEIKSEKEKDFQRQIEDAKKAYNHELTKRTRLSFDNEALQWHLKQRSEQLHIVEAKLQEVSATHDSLNASQLSSSHNRTSLSNGSAAATGGNANTTANATLLQVDESTSPPASPSVKGIIEKSDSVSWVFQMDDETPEAAASKLVKRAGSFRSMERCPSTRRQLSLSANATLMGGGGSSNGYVNGLNGSAGEVAPNPLSLSMSATSVIRQHSCSDTTSAADAASAARAQARIRSKSVSIKCNEPLQLPATPAAAATAVSSKLAERKIGRQLSLAAGIGNGKGSTGGSWLEPICASSPFRSGGAGGGGNIIRPRTSTLKEESPHAEAADGGAGAGTMAASSSSSSSLFRRNAKAQKLITCDTSALNSGERLEMRSLPTHASMQELKAHATKCHHGRDNDAAAGGDAMIASTTSEDEICSASSDEIGSTASATTGPPSTASSSSSSSSLQQPHGNDQRPKSPHAQMSLDELIMIDKISSNSLSGTPMEVSWSEDGNDVL